MKKLSALVFTTGTYLSLSLPAFAQGLGLGGETAKKAAAASDKNVINPCPPGQFNSLCALNFSGNLLGNIITLAFIISALIALGFLIFGGIKWITSGGDKAGVEGARNTIVASLVGLVIVFLAYFLIRLIFTFFGLDFGNFTIPNIQAKG